ncbi:hypothetical protein [Bradyrhizobium sp. WD16]|uniref:hypothetical protein n=1 Tax=Bradyrhizobium sp. WD16 TaxID=1521768 RepID=UPI0020A5FF4E|nr:hypothetical protein [Bradyrhizobium sp. WD16]UTD27974.1 hypothetical protein DB459_14715 [Bradyrhizobium sp. WD16]
MSKKFEVRLRLREIAKKSAELTAASLMLDDMALQLDQLRELTGRPGLLGDRHLCREVSDSR